MEKRSVGSVEILALVDNVMAWPATSVYVDFESHVERFRGYFDDAGNLALNFGCFLVRDGGFTLLVDTGWGPEFNGRLPAELEAAGVRPEEIDAVLFTHLHGDHTSWNIDRATGQPRFPRARHLVPRADWEAMRPGGSQPAESCQRDVAPLITLGMVDFLEGEERTLSPSLTAVPTPGHTPGHTSVAIAAAGEHGFILGDVIISKVDAELPELKNGFDSSAETAYATRRQVIERLLRERALVGASHLPAPGFGRLVQRNGGTAWQEA